MGMCTACSEEGSVRSKPAVKRKPAAKAKIAKVMDEFASGDLKRSDGTTVPPARKDMAIAIALDSARRAAKKKS